MIFYFSNLHRYLINHLLESIHIYTPGTKYIGGYIVFAFSVIMFVYLFVCLFVNFLVRKIVRIDGEPQHDRVIANSLS